MIPTNQTIRKRCGPSVRIEPNAFALAEEYIRLSRECSWNTPWEAIERFLSFFGPLFYALVQMVLGSWGPMSFLSLTGTVQRWMRAWRYGMLQIQIDEWVRTVRSIGGPFISTNDPTYHVYVYADGMERIRQAYA